jgi:hypothetical protein
MSTLSDMIGLNLMDLPIPTNFQDNAPLRLASGLVFIASSNRNCSSSQCCGIKNLTNENPSFRRTTYLLTTFSAACIRSRASIPPSGFEDGKTPPRLIVVYNSSDTSQMMFILLGELSVFDDDTSNLPGSLYRKNFTWISSCAQS